MIRRQEAMKKVGLLLIYKPKEPFLDEILLWKRQGRQITVSGLMDPVGRRFVPREGQQIADKVGDRVEKTWRWLS